MTSDRIGNGAGPPGNGRGGRHRRARVEVGLVQSLAGRPDIGPAERAALRAQAHAVDLAEAAEDPDAVSTANRVYLDLRSAAGLVGGMAPHDLFADLVTELATPTPGVLDRPRLGE
jgi:hypothetical protein